MKIFRILSAFDDKYECIVYSHNGGKYGGVYVYVVMVMLFLGRFDEHFVFRKLCEKGYSPTVSMSEHKIFEMVLFDNLNIIYYFQMFIGHSKIKTCKIEISVYFLIFIFISKFSFRDSYLLMRAPLVKNIF